ncbi:MAG: CDP-glycerol glycerophosphotransferase family protein [Rhabdochlamydiaceae bacterium]|nr:CDP-glycerol glycerophosphotransferase family protein [Rhabdochlamydiaceae bacterium]
MKAVTLLTGPSTHLDHIGILSSQLEIPLIVTDEKTHELAKAFYPQFDVHFYEMSALSYEMLASHFDLIFQSGRSWTARIQPTIELLFGKKMRMVFCPHGNSDKGHSFRNHPEQDLYLVYGDHLFDHLKKTGALETIKKVFYTGNYRLLFYKQHKDFYDALVETHVFSHFLEPKPTILYAPTWLDEEGPSSFFDETDALIDQLGTDYNLVIKLHPFLEQSHPERVFQIIDRHQHHRSVRFLTDFPPIYPLLARCDLYIGDFSSVGYDFLAFNRPLYFFNPLSETTAPPSCLFRCGIQIPTQQKKRLKAFLEETRMHAECDFAKARNETYAYAFGKEKDLKDLREEIWNYVLK